MKHHRHKTTTTTTKIQQQKRKKKKDHCYLTTTRSFDPLHRSMDKTSQAEIQAIELKWALKLKDFNQLGMKHRWSSGRILACHAGDPGSIPGRCKLFFFPSFFSFPFFFEGGGGLGLFVSLEIAVYFHNYICKNTAFFTRFDYLHITLLFGGAMGWGWREEGGGEVGVVSQSKIKIKSTKNTIIAVWMQLGHSILWMDQWTKLHRLKSRPLRIWCVEMLFEVERF